MLTAPSTNSVAIGQELFDLILNFENWKEDYSFEKRTNYILSEKLKRRRFVDDKMGLNRYFASYIYR